MYFILTQKDFYQGTLYCKYNEEEKRNECKYAEGKELPDGYKTKCYTEEYSTIGLQSNIIFYRSDHFCKAENNESLYYYETLTSSNGKYQKEIEIYGENTVNYEKAISLLFKPLKEVINEKNVKISYTIQEIKDLEAKINKGNYQFYNEKQKVLEK